MDAGPNCLSRHALQKSARLHAEHDVGRVAGRRLGTQHRDSLAPLFVIAPPVPSPPPPPPPRPSSERSILLRLRLPVAVDIDRSKAVFRPSRVGLFGLCEKQEEESEGRAVRAVPGAAAAAAVGSVPRARLRTEGSAYVQSTRDSVPPPSQFAAVSQSD